METVIGSHLPYATELETQDSDFNPLSVIRAAVEWSKLLFAEVFDNLNPESEADVLVAVDGDHRVLDYFLVRSSRELDADGPEGSGILIGENGTPEEWIASLVPMMHNVEGMDSWYWIHKHPEGMPVPGDKDEYFSSLAQAQDFLQFGHPGSIKHYQDMLVVTKATVMQAEARFGGISPEIDGRIARKFADAYANALGEDHPLTIAEAKRASVLEERATREAENPIADLMWAMENLLPAEMALVDAKANADIPQVSIALEISAFESGHWVSDVVTGDHITIGGEHRELNERSRASRAATTTDAEKEQLRHLHEEWLAARERPSDEPRVSDAMRQLGFGKPTKQPDPNPEAPVVLSPTLLADLSGFDFSALD